MTSQEAFASNLAVVDLGVISAFETFRKISQNFSPAGVTFPFSRPMPLSAVSRVSMHQITDAVHNAFQQRRDRDEQSSQKEHWMHRDAKTDCERDQ
jgi:lipoate-protein ligase A